MEPSIAVLISGTGRSLKNLLDLQAARRLPVRVVLVISSRADAAGLQIAADYGVPSAVFRREDARSTSEFSERIFEHCRAAAVDLVVLAGFLKHLLIPADFQNRVLNIHPSLIPAFCGTGYYGMRVHEAVLASGARVTGCTVHYVDDEYDHGPIILQKTVPVLDDDTPETLAARVFAAECQALPEALKIVTQTWKR